MIAAALISRASEIVELDPGKQFRIETSPGGAEVLDVIVPAGKHWSVGVSITVIETDA